MNMHTAPQTLKPLDQQAYALLCNLARRLRMARRVRRNAVTSGVVPPEVLAHMEGQELEAWNSFQGAKAVIAECR